MSENDYKIFEKIMSDDKLARCCNKAIKIWNLNTGLALKNFDIMSQITIGNETNSPLIFDGLDFNNQNASNTV